MKKYETVTKSVAQTTQVDLICDICGISENDWDLYPGNTKEYNNNEVTIEHDFGNSWPSGGSGEKLSLDVCPRCFNDKILPFIKSIAILPIEYKEWDY